MYTLGTESFSYTISSALGGAVVVSFSNNASVLCGSIGSIFVTGAQEKRKYAQRNSEKADFAVAFSIGFLRFEDF
jgi:hypothetical protein